MSIKKNIFDLADLDDIPQNIALSLSERPTTKRLLHLMNLTKEPVSCTQVKVAFYRLYKTPISRQSVSNTLSKMAKNGLIVKISRGMYQQTITEKEH